MAQPSQKSARRQIHGVVLLREERRYSNPADPDRKRHQAESANAAAQPGARGRRAEQRRIDGKPHMERREAVQRPIVGDEPRVHTFLRELGRPRGLDRQQQEEGEPDARLKNEPSRISPQIVRGDGQPRNDRQQKVYRLIEPYPPRNERHRPVDGTARQRQDRHQGNALNREVGKAEEQRQGRRQRQLQPPFGPERTSGGQSGPQPVASSDGTARSGTRRPPSKRE